MNPCFPNSINSMNVDQNMLFLPETMDMVQTIDTVKMSQNTMQYNTITPPAISSMNQTQTTLGDINIHQLTETEKIKSMDQNEGQKENISAQKTDQTNSEINQVDQKNGQVNQENNENTYRPIIKIVTENIVMKIMILKDDIINETNRKLAGRKQRIIYDLEIFLKKRLEKLQNNDDDDDSSSGDADDDEDDEDEDEDDDDDDDDITRYIRDSDDNSDNNDNYYKETESEYEFTETEENLTKQMKNKMNDVRKELNKLDSNDMIKITKCYTYY
jgi:hypothetical protein